MGFAWAGPLAWGALSGMEVPLAAVLVALALLTLAHDRPLWTALLTGLAALALWAGPGLARAATLLFYLDRFRSNEPVEGATIQVDTHTGSLTAAAQPG